MNPIDIAEASTEYDRLKPGAKERMAHERAMQREQEQFEQELNWSYLEASQQIQERNANKPPPPPPTQNTVQGQKAVSELSDDELRVKVAELCGWNGYFRDSIPDYCTNLNHMHETEKMLKPDDWPQYLRKLVEMNESEHRFEVENRFAVVSSTARQRAEAFVATLSQKTTEKTS